MNQVLPRLPRDSHGQAEVGVTWRWQLCSFTALWVALVAVSPLVQDPAEYHIDWLLTLSEIHGTARRFGTDVLFTYGPWGFTWGGYHPRTYLTTCVVWTALAVMFWWAGAKLFAPLRRSTGDGWAGVLLIAWALLLQGHNSEFADSRFFLLPFLLLVYGFACSRRPTDALTLSLCAAVAFSGLVKFPYLVAGLVAVGALTVDQFRSRRSTPWPLVTFVGTFLVGWVLGGQRLVDLPVYLRTSVATTAGYADAMQLTADLAWIELTGFLAIAIGSCVLIAALGSVLARPRRLLLLAAMLVLEWIVFRASYVRHDQHAAIASGLLVAFIPALVAAFWPGLRGRWGRRVAMYCVVLSLGLQAWEGYRYDHGRTPYSPVETARSSVQMAYALADVASGRPTAPAVAYETLLKQTRDGNPLPPMTGTVDLVPEKTTLLLAHHLNYDPRPTLQSYSAYSPALAAANAAKYAGPNAPANVLFCIEPMDSRVASIEDNLLWLELLKRYQVAAEAGNYLHLVLRKTPRTARFVLIKDEVDTLGKPITVPVTTRGQLIWAKFELKVRPFGKLVAQLYKPPPVYIAITLPDGRTYYRRYITANGAEGFLLSPFVYSNDAFASLMTRPVMEGDLSALRPVHVSLLPVPDPLKQPHFYPEVHSQFYALSFDTPAPP